MTPRINLPFFYWKSLGRSSFVGEVYVPLTVVFQLLPCKYHAAALSNGTPRWCFPRALPRQDRKHKEFADARDIIWPANTLLLARDEQNSVQCNSCITRTGVPEAAWEGAGNRSEKTEKGSGRDGRRRKATKARAEIMSKCEATKSGEKNGGSTETETQRSS